VFGFRVYCLLFLFYFTRSRGSVFCATTEFFVSVALCGLGERISSSRLSFECRSEVSLRRRRTGLEDSTKLSFPRCRSPPHFLPLILPWRCLSVLLFPLARHAAIFPFGFLCRFRSRSASRWSQIAAADSFRVFVPAREASVPTWFSLLRVISTPHRSCPVLRRLFFLLSLISRLQFVCCFFLACCSRGRVLLLDGVADLKKCS
jgi:hypothetical protein